VSNFTNASARIPIASSCATVQYVVMGAGIG
jgi:hypothetical protein